jgi:hypothetical protein
MDKNCGKIFFFLLFSFCLKHLIFSPHYLDRITGRQKVGSLQRKGPFDERLLEAKSLKLQKLSR